MIPDPSIARHIHDFHYTTNQEHSWDYPACKVCHFSPDKDWLNAVCNLIDDLRQRSHMPTRVHDLLDAVNTEDYTYHG